MTRLLHEDLTYKIRGCCFRVHNTYGGGHKEVIYQCALGEELEAVGIKFVREPRLQVLSKRSGKQLGWYQPDFVVEGVILVELKVLEFLTRQALYQLATYLKSTSYELGLLINFSTKGCDVKRILDPSKRRVGTHPGSSDLNPG